MRYLRQTAALFALGFLGLYFGRDLGREPNATTTRSEPEIAGGVATVRRTPISRQLQLEGTLLPMAQTHVVSPIAGQVIELRFKAGDVVAAGAVVGAIAPADLATRLARQRAAVEAARQSLQASEDELKAATLRLVHYQELFAGDLIARREVEEREVALDAARAQAEFTQAQLAQQKAILGQLQIMQSVIKLTAPASGRVSRVLAGPGTTVDRDRLIMTLDAAGALRLGAETDGSLPDLRPGLKARVSIPALPGIIAHGAVLRAAAKESTDGVKTAIEIQIDNPPGALRPGMLARAELDLPAREAALLVPRAAVVSAGVKNYVYKISGRVAVRQPVTLGPEWQNEIIVLNGLVEGERVALDPSKISEGLRKLQ